MKPSHSQESKRFLLLYASQTGQAKAIAEEISDVSSDHGLRADLFCIGLTDKRFSIEKEPCVVIITSTTGDGEPPDSAIKLYRRLCRHTTAKDFLKTVNFTLLALGDSNYIKFCFFGRQLERRLRELSANCFYSTGYGDDAYGIETGVDPWMSGLWPALKKQLGVDLDIHLNGVTTGNKSSILQSTNSERMNIPITIVPEGSDVTFDDLQVLIKDFDADSYRLPKLPAPILCVKFEDGTKACFKPSESLMNNQVSPLSKVRIISGRKLTSGDDVKDTYEVTFKFQEDSVPYIPGDAFGLICSNHEEEVDLLLNRLNILHLADKVVNLQLHESCSNKRKLPSHILPRLSLKDVFLHCIEIRSVPKKILLRVLAEYSSHEEDKLFLLYLSSQGGSKAYTDIIRKPSLNILDLLLHFKSCNPPLEKLLEYLPNMKPRFYSVASSPLNDGRTFTTVFNVLKFKKEEGRMYDRDGVCTGWLKTLISGLANVEVDDLNCQMSGLNINSSISNINQPYILVYKRRNLHFCLPDNKKSPLIMIGPGTGVAPFMGFLRHRKILSRNKEKDVTYGQMYLLYGCRYKDNDFLYKSELEDLKSCGVITKLMLSHSRETPRPLTVTTRYVHESIREHAESIVSAIEAGGIIFVCGDAKHMAQDVQQAFVHIFQTTMGKSETDAKDFVLSLQSENRYVNDVWI